MKDEGGRALLLLLLLILLSLPGRRYHSVVAPVALIGEAVGQSMVPRSGIVVEGSKRGVGNDYLA